MEDALLLALEMSLKKRLDPKRWSVGSGKIDIIWTINKPEHNDYIVIHRLIKEHGNEWGVVVLTIEHHPNRLVFHSPLMPHNEWARGYEYADPNFDPDKFINELVEWIVAERSQSPIR